MTFQLIQIHNILHRNGYTQHVQLMKEIGSQKCKAALANLESIDFADYAGQVVEFLDDETRRALGQP